MLPRLQRYARPHPAASDTDRPNRSEACCLGYSATRVPTLLPRVQVDRTGARHAASATALRASPPCCLGDRSTEPERGMLPRLQRYARPPLPNYLNS
jgi:hypothetical protein